MHSPQKTLAALESGTFSMTERLWAGLEKIAATKVYEDLNRPTPRSLGTMVGMSKKVVDPLLCMGLVKATAYRLGNSAYEDITTTPLGRRALESRGISYPVRYPAIGDVERVPYYSLARAQMNARIQNEESD